VSASRVRRAQNAVLASRPYAQYAYDVLVNVAAQSTGDPLHPLLYVHEPVERIGILLIAGDRGLAGAYNANVIRRAMRFVQYYKRPVHWVTVGRRGRDSIRRWIARLQRDENAPEWLKDQEIIAEYSQMPADPDLQDIASIAESVFDEFLNVPVHEFFIAYTHFINTVTQQPRVLPLLPLRPFETHEKQIIELVQPDPQVRNRTGDYLFEPDAARIMEEVIPRLTQLQILQAVRESLSSEHSARMVAMRNASESAEALSDALQLEYNKARQLVITNEILDIIGGVEALSDKT